MQGTLSTGAQQARYSNLKRLSNKATGEVMEFTATAADTGGEYVEFILTAPPGFAGPPRHTHPLQEETFEVISGMVGVEIDGNRQILKPGERITAPTGSKHSLWAEGDSEVKVRTRLAPALHFAEMLDAIHRSANDRNSEMPAIVDAAIIMQLYKAEYDAVFLPPPIRLIVMPLLAVIGRLNGRAKVIDGWIEAHYRQ